MHLLLCTLCSSNSWSLDLQALQRDRPQDCRKLQSLVHWRARKVQALRHAPYLQGQQVVSVSLEIALLYYGIGNVKLNELITLAFLSFFYSHRIIPGFMAQGTKTKQNKTTILDQGPLEMHADRDA